MRMLAMRNYVSRMAAILGEKPTASAETRKQTVRQCCGACFVLLIVPTLETVWVVAFHSWPGLWLGTLPWVLSAALGLLFGLQACSLADRRADGLPIAALSVHFVSLLALVMGAILAATQYDG